jgi:hypothetical protein
LVQLGVLCYSHAVMGYCFFILQNWIPTFLASFGGSGQGIAVTGGLSSIPWIAAAVVGPLAGQAANNLIKSGTMGQLAVRRLMQVYGGGIGGLIGCNSNSSMRAGEVYDLQQQQFS